MVLVINKSDSHCAVVRVSLQTELDSTQSYYNYKITFKKVVVPFKFTTQQTERFVQYILLVAFYPSAYVPVNSKTAHAAPPPPGKPPGI